jgi:hypothetical protein
MPYARVGAGPSISLILPKLEEIKTIFEGVESKGNRVWKRWIGSRVLDSKCSTTDGRVVERVGRKKEPRPALRMIVFICVILCSARAAKKSLAEVSGEVRESVNGIMMSLLPSTTRRASRPAVEVEAVRIVAITVVLGRWRREAARPSPIPVKW